MGSCEKSDTLSAMKVSFGWRPFGASPTNETTNQISDLYAVPYIIEVTDLVNCVVVDTIDLYELTEPLQTISSVINIVSCFEGDDGGLSNFTIGGMPPYDYVWINENSDTVSTDEDAIGIPAGT